MGKSRANVQLVFLQIEPTCQHFALRTFDSFTLSLSTLNYLWKKMDLLLTTTLDTHCTIVCCIFLCISIFSLGRSKRSSNVHFTHTHTRVHVHPYEHFLYVNSITETFLWYWWAKARLRHRFYCFVI